MSQADSLRHIADLWDALEARCDELNEACSVKQGLLDHVAADERDFMELVEGYKRERDAARAEASRLRAALQEIADDCDGGFIPCDRCGDEVQMKDCDMHYTARRALAGKETP